MIISTRKLLGIIVTAAKILSFDHLAQAQFTPGGLIVDRVGTGSATLSNAATAVFLDEYATTAGQTAPLFSASVSLTQSGTATSEGLITRSADGSSILVPGYSTAAGTAGVASTTSTAVPRGVAVFGLGGTQSSVTTLGTSAFSGNNIRGAASPDGSTLFTAGGTGGIYSATAGNNGSTLVSSTTANNRVADIFNGNLFYSTGSGTARGIYQVGTSGTPTAAATASNVFINTGSSSSPYGFAISPDGKTVYVADDSTGIMKYMSTTGAAGSFVAAGSFGTGTDARGLAVDFSGTNAVIYATGIAASANTLFSFTDTGSFAVTTTVLATAGANQVFRGLDFAPVPEPATVFGGILLVGVLGWNQRRRLRGVRPAGSRAAAARA